MKEKERCVDKNTNGFCKCQSSTRLSGVRILNSALEKKVQDYSFRLFYVQDSEKQTLLIVTQMPWKGDQIKVLACPLHILHQASFGSRQYSVSVWHRGCYHLVWDFHRKIMLYLTALYVIKAYLQLHDVMLNKYLCDKRLNSVGKI